MINFLIKLLLVLAAAAIAYAVIGSIVMMVSLWRATREDKK